jgi:hypothetical protein
MLACLGMVDTLLLLAQLERMGVQELLDKLSKNEPMSEPSDHS